MDDVSLEDVVDFIHQFQAFYGATKNGAIQDFRAAFKRLQSEFLEIEKQSIEQARVAAPRFNIFALLGLSQFEVRTHSAMLAHLLNPGASHGQQDLFLGAFLNECAQSFPDFPLPSEDISIGHWQTYTEILTPFGRLDIVLRSPDLNYLCVIENKVYAGEQPDQLRWYAEWLSTQLQDYPLQALVYLTIDGYSSSTAQGADHFCIAYKREIDIWLSRTIPNIQAPVVKTVIQQYLDLIRKF